jgi:transcriptional regulator with XRE-family HTH domain
VTTRRNSGTPDAGGRGWADYVQANLDSLGWSNSTLASQADIDRSLIGRWLNEGTQPSVESVRVVTRAFGRPVWEGIVAAEILTEDELKATPPPSREPDLRLASDDTLLAEVRRRMRRGRGGTPHGEQISTEIEEQSGVDVGEIEEEPRRDGHTSRRRPSQAAS